MANNPMIFRNNQYDDMINASAQKYGVSPQLVRSVIGVESSWNPNAASGTGPVGLMQISKALAKDYGYKPEDRLDPAKNIDMGARYLAQNLKAFNGNVQHALLGYNQGTGGARQMLSGKKPMAEEGKKYMNNPQFTGVIDNKAYMRPNAQGGVDSSANYLKTDSASYSSPEQAETAGNQYGLGATANLLNKAQAGMGNKVTPEKEQFNPEDLKTPGTPDKTKSWSEDLTKILGGIALIAGAGSGNEEQQRLPEAGAGIRRGSPYRGNDSLARQMVAQNFSQMYGADTFGGKW